MICPRCQSNNEEGSLFCANCGYNLAPTEPVQPQPTEPVQPVATEPVVTEPVQSQPVATEPVQPQPVEPVATEPVRPVEPQGSTEKPKKKNIFLPIIIVLIIACLVVAGIFLWPKGGKSNKTSNNPESVAKSYINDIIEGKYEDSYSLLYLPENSFVSNADYSKLVQEDVKYYSDLATKKVDSFVDSEVNGDEATYKVKLKYNNGNEGTLTINLKNDNGWKVVENPRLYIDDWPVVVPKGTKLSIDGKEVPESLVVEDESVGKYYKKYVIPAIGTSEKEFSLKHNLQNKTVKITPEISYSAEKISIEIENKELLEKASKFLEDSWNEMYQASLDGEDVQTIASKYFDSSVSIDDIKTYYASIKPSFEKPLGGLINSYNTGFSISDVKIDTAYVQDEFVIGFNFKYTYHFTTVSYGTKWPSEHAKDSAIRLTYKDDTFKIYNVVYPSFYEND